MAIKPFVPVPRVLKVRLSGGITGAGNWAVLDWWKYAGLPPTNVDLNSFASSIHSAFATALAPQFNSEFALTVVSVEDQTSTTAAVGTWGGSTPGSGGAFLLPASAAVLESKHGALRYRGGHSRTYWPPLGAAGAIADLNQWNTQDINTFATQLGVYLNSIISAGAALQFGPIQRSIVHYAPKQPVAGIAYPYVEDVASNNVETHIASQRRRLARLSS